MCIFLKTNTACGVAGGGAGVLGLQGSSQRPRLDVLVGVAPRYHSLVSRVATLLVV